jgi:two-component system, cell cycle response regulator DivK
MKIPDAVLEGKVARSAAGAESPYWVGRRVAQEFSSLGSVSLMWDGIENNMRILLVEDAPFLRYAFGRLLRMHGYEVQEANDGRAAMECVPGFRPQLVLTDLRMPVMDGLELIRRLRSDPKTADLPIMAITADASEQLENRVRAAGVVDFLTKPVNMPELLDRLRVFRDETRPSGQSNCALT